MMIKNVNILTGLTEILQGALIDGEMSYRGTELRTHVGHCRPVGDTQSEHSRPEELHELAYHAQRSKVLELYNNNILNT